MITYTAARILSQVLDSQGDGTGTTNQLPAAKTVSGATNATPIVVTATSHGYSDGDFVHITGVVGNTACNDLHVIANKTSNTFELTTPAGTNVAGNGAYSSAGAAHLCFACKPAAGVKFCIHHLHGTAVDSVIDAKKYLYETALTVGIKVQVRQDTTLVHTLSPIPIQTGPHWQLGAVQTWFAEGAQDSPITWSHSYDSCAVNLNGDADEFFVILHSDALAVDSQEISVIGEVL